MTSTITPPDQERNHATVLANGQGKRLSELDESVIIELFKRHGAILFRGFSLNLKGPAAFGRARAARRIVLPASGSRPRASIRPRTIAVNPVASIPARRLSSAG